MDARWRVGYRRAGGWTNDAVDSGVTVFYVGWRRELVDPDPDGDADDEKEWFMPHLLRIVQRLSMEKPFYGFVDNQFYETTQGLSLYAGLRWSNMDRQFMFDHDRWMRAETDRTVQVPRVFWGNYFGAEMCRRLGESMLDQYAQRLYPLPSGEPVNHGQIVSSGAHGGRFVTMTRDVRMCPPDRPPEGHVFENMLFWHRQLGKRGMLA